MSWQPIEILFTGGVWQTLPGKTPLGQTPPAQCMLGYTPPPPQRPLQWTVRILLECILVQKGFLCRNLVLNMCLCGEFIWNLFLQSVKPCCYWTCTTSTYWVIFCNSSFLTAVKIFVFQQNAISKRFPLVFHRYFRKGCSKQTENHSRNEGIPSCEKQQVQRSIFC